ncbi:MAG TPA: DUF1295 domain-containing protein [Candidatus Olsenella excrementavium]|uniref:DUF1295 domain-containing protein n=1 Tax=Candidatus Olsenella excrementavium TaxID=2838709 RepID=A0A9D2CHX7_9ACTN|nr:DUF1295 domain-containing protein [Candidatus Olsenella excrementavium]
MNWVLVGTLFAVALVACCMGFKRFVWFMSVGYGLAVAAIALATLATKAGNEPPVFVKALAWLFMGALYVCETAGLHLRLANGTPDDVVLWVGVVVMAAGAVIEAVADQQKSAQKAKHPDLPATEGLFSIVRCPNYLGEMLFWTGVLIAGATSLAGAGQWAMALVGFVCIIFIMLDGARRMAKGHEERYGQDLRYRAYADRTKLIIPFVW